MDTPCLNSKNIFAVPAGDFWNIDSEKIFILYAPLSGQSALVQRNDIEKMESCAAGMTDDTRTSHLIERLSAVADLHFFRMNKDPEEINQVDILSNYTCNFKCVYCYSAKGRSNKVIEWESIKAVIDNLFCSGKEQRQAYNINFSGGGEPLMSFDLIKKTVDYIEAVAGGYKYNLGIVSNCSLLTPEIADFLKEHDINLAVSFEILKELQDRERGEYDKVASNIDLLLSRKVKFGIRTTFTHESVGRMSDMITELHDRFPLINSVVFDVVLSPDLFKTPDDLDSYYKDFITEYFKAKKYGETLGIFVSSIAVETLNMLRDRTCEGKIVLTPMGTISACSRISSPEETLYKDYIYGEVKNGRLCFDKEKFNQIMADNNVYTQEICRNCYAKWNCGGGCRLFHNSFGEEYLPAKCNFSKEGLRIELYNSLCRKYRAATGKDLHETIKERIENGLI